MKSSVTVRLKREAGPMTVNISKQLDACGLVRYDTMCRATAACHSVDEVKDLRDKAKALQVYAKQAKNYEAERKAGEIRIRAERRAGELLREMKQRGERDPGGRGRVESRPTTQLSDLGITRDQSSKCPRHNFVAI
jgi:hypothetical protein